MKEFDIGAPCPKCGYFEENAFVEYRVGPFDPGSALLDHLLSRQSITDATGSSVNEYLLRTCRRCGYKWPERVIAP